MPRYLSRFIRYQGASVAGFLIDLAVLAVLIFGFQVNYLLATALGFTAAVIFGFFVNRMWSFKKWVHIGRLSVALAVGGATLCVVLFFTYIGVESMNLPYYYARSGAALIAALVSYVGDSLFTFEMEPFE